MKVMVHFKIYFITLGKCQGKRLARGKIMTSLYLVFVPSAPDKML